VKTPKTMSGTSEESRLEGVVDDEEVSGVTDVMMDGFIVNCVCL